MIITIPGNPIPQQRMRIYRRYDTARVYDPNGRDKWIIKRDLRLFMAENYPDWVFPKSPRIYYEFFMPIKKQISKKLSQSLSHETTRHTNRPDVDNLIKLYMDCLLDIVVDDDSQVNLGWAHKLYSPNPRTVIYIEESAPYVRKTDSPPGKPPVYVDDWGSSLGMDIVV